MVDPASPRKGRNRLVFFAKWGLLGYLAACSVLFIFQRDLIFQPSKQLTKLPPGFCKWTTPRGQFLGYKRVEGKSSCLFFLHGNAGNASGWTHRVTEFPGDVFVLEYPGYGERPGSPSEKTLGKAAVSAFDGIPAYPYKVVAAQSIGTGILPELLRQRPVANAVVMITPMTCLKDMAKRAAPFVPSSLVLDRMPVLNAWSNYPGYICAVIAGRDEVIPADQSERFLQASNQHRRTLVLPEAGHNTIQLSRKQWEDISQLRIASSPTTFPFRLGTEERSQIQTNLAALHIGDDLQSVLDRMGPASSREQIRSGPQGKPLGSVLTYWLSKESAGATGPKDEVLCLMFDAQDHLARIAANFGKPQKGS